MLPLSCIFSSRKFSLVMHFSILLISRHIFPRTSFSSRIFSFYARLLTVFSHSLVSSRLFASSAPSSTAFPTVPFPVTNFSVVSLLHTFFPLETISIVNLLVNPSACFFFTASLFLSHFFFIDSSRIYVYSSFVLNFLTAHFFIIPSRVPYFPAMRFSSRSLGRIFFHRFFHIRLVRCCRPLQHPRGPGAGKAAEKEEEGSKKEARERERERTVQMKFNKISSPLVPRTRT